MKKFKVTPAEVFALEFEDGTEIEMCFNMKSLAYLGELINNNLTQLSGPKFYASILYAGIKSMNPDFTEDEADALYITLEKSQPEAMNAILNEYFEASGISKDEIKKNLMNQMRFTI